MAEYTFGTSNSAITGKLTVTYTQNTSANTSTLTCTLAYKKASGYDKTYGTFSGGIKVNNSRKTLTKYVELSGGTWVTIGSQTFTVEHNSNGEKTVTIVVDGGISGSSFSSTNSNSNKLVLTSIQRKPKINSIKLASKTNYSVNFAWTSDVTTNKTSYRVLQGTTTVIGWKTTTFEGKSGTITVSGLSPNTSYKIEFEVSRYLDKDVWSESSFLSVATYDYPKITNKEVGFNIEQESLIINFSNPCDDTFTLSLLSGDTIIKSVSDINGTSYTWTFDSDQNDSLYSLCPNNTSLPISFKIVTTINSKDYTNIKTGTASVQQSLNIPSTPDFSIECSDSDLNTLLGTTTTLIQGRGTITLTINTKSITKNYSTFTTYMASIQKNGYAYQYAETTKTAFSFEPIQASGTFEVRLRGKDSRGYQSEVKIITVEVLPYQPPRLNVQVARVNSFEKELTLKLVGFISKLTVGSNNKNQFVTLSYNENGSSYTSLKSQASVTTDIDAESYTISLSKPESDPWKTLDSSISTSYKFKLCDSLNETFVKVTVGQGIAPVAILENGKLIVNKSPDVNGAGLQVNGGSDIDGGLTVDDTDVMANIALMQNNISNIDSTISSMQTFMNAILPYKGICTDPNNALETGLYIISSPKSNSPGFNYGVMQVISIPKSSSSSDKFIQQTVTNVVGSDYAYRTRNENTWQPWKLIGTYKTSEVLTNETYNGKLVYSKLVIVTLPNTATVTTKSHGCSFGKYYWVDMGNSFVHQTNGTGISYPLNNGFYNISVRLGTSEVGVKTNETGWSGWEACILIKYVK